MYQTGRSDWLVVREDLVRSGECSAHDTCELLVLGRLVARLLIFRGSGGSEEERRRRRKALRQQTPTPL